MTAAASSTQAMQLSLGTVQFGLAYGAVGLGHQVTPEMAASILAQAWADGVRLLDTAASYGDIENRLLGLCDKRPFRIVSKIRPLGTLSAPEKARALQQSMEGSVSDLGEQLDALLFHSAADLLSSDGDALWKAARAALAGSTVRLGVSCYAPQELIELRSRFDIQIAQLPGNALDQRLHQMPALDGVELHLRSAFLQGLLLQAKAGARRVPAAAKALQAWESRCTQARLSPAVAALGVVKDLPRVAHCVVGVESLDQWREIHKAWQEAQALHWPELASDDPEVFDPRVWPKT